MPVFRPYFVLKKAPISPVFFLIGPLCSVPKSAVFIWIGSYTRAFGKNCPYFARIFGISGLQAVFKGLK